MTWWTWMILAMVLLGAELFAIDAQFFLVFIGISAAIVSILSVVGIEMPESVQWMIFGGLSLISMFTFRKALYNKVHGGLPDYRVGVNGEFVVIPENLEAGKQSRVSFRGTNWTVVNDGTTQIAAGTRVRVARTEGLTLFVTAEST